MRDFRKNKEKVFIDNLLKEDIQKLQLIASTGYDFNNEVSDIMHLKDVSPINICAQYQLKNSLDFLLSQGISLNYLDVNHRNFLMFCVIFSRDKGFDFLEYVLEKDHNIHHRDYDGKNVLCYFYRCDEPLRLLKILINKGADVRQNVGEGRNFFDYFLHWYNHRMRENVRDKMQEVGLYLVDLMTPYEVEKYLQIQSPIIVQKVKTILEHEELQKCIKGAKSIPKKMFKL